MKKLKPYFLLALPLIIFSFLSILQFKENIVLNFSDTYFVIAYSHLFYLFTLFFGVLFFIYFVLYFLKIDIFNTSIWYLILGILVITLIIFYLNYLSNEYDSKPKKIEDLINPVEFNKYIIISVLLFLIFQFFLLITFFSILFKKVVKYLNK